MQTMLETWDTQVPFWKGSYVVVTLDRTLERGAKQRGVEQWRV